MRISIIPFVFLGALTVLVSTTGCRKYGYKFDDGFDKGAETPTAGGAWSPLGNDFTKLTAAKIFPGLMSASESRGETTVSIKMDQKYVKSSDLRVYYTPDALYSTGLYAPAGEPVMIEVPSGYDGLTVQIGGWTDNLMQIPVLNRDPVVSNQMQLSAGKNYVRNLYGGTIYIKKNINVSYAQVTLKFSGVAKSADFILGETSDSEWRNMIRNSTVPWFQLRGRRIIFELPKYMVDKFPIENPTALMEEWDRFMDLDVHGWKGLEEVTTDSLNKAPELPVRVIMDAQPAAAYAHYGSPVVLQMDENLFVDEIGNLNNLTTKGAWRTMAMIAANTITHTWRPAEIPDINLLHIVKFADRVGISSITSLNPDIRLSVDTALLYVQKSLDTTRNIEMNFGRDIRIYKNNYLIRLVPLLQLLHEYGNGLFTFIDYRARHYVKTSMTNQEKINFLYQSASEYARKDLYMFFYVWGLLPSDATRDLISVQFPKLETDIYNYNPVTDTGGTGPVAIENRNIPKVTWDIADFCCQETEAGSAYATNLIDGDPTTAWHSQWQYSDATRYHLPHYIIFDMNKFYDVKGVWYYVTHIWLPKNINVYFSSDFDTWSAPESFQGMSKVGYMRKEFNTTYTHVRYIKFEIMDVWASSANKACSFSEFGALKP